MRPEICNIKSLYFCNTNYCNDASMVSTPSKFNLCLFNSQKTNFFDQDYVASCYYATGYTDVKSTAPCPSNTECCYVNDNIFSNHITTKINQFFYIQITRTSRGVRYAPTFVASCSTCSDSTYTSFYCNSDNCNSISVFEGKSDSAKQGQSLLFLIFSFFLLTVLNAFIY